MCSSMQEGLVAQKGQDDVVERLWVPGELLVGLHAQHQNVLAMQQDSVGCLGVLLSGKGPALVRNEDVTPVVVRQQVQVACWKSNPRLARARSWPAVHADTGAPAEMRTAL